MFPIYLIVFLSNEFLVFDLMNLSVDSLKKKGKKNLLHVLVRSEK